MPVIVSLIITTILGLTEKDPAFCPKSIIANSLLLNMLYVIKSHLGSWLSQTNFELGFRKPSIYKDIMHKNMPEKSKGIRNTQHREGRKTKKHNSTKIYMLSSYFCS